MPNTKVSSDHEALRSLNIDIGEREAKGDVKFFVDHLAPAFSMLRADGTINDFGQFIKKVGPSPARKTEVESITPFGDHRAVVTCTVTLGQGADEVRFHNLRVFIHADSPDTPWLLLAWANERLPHVTRSEES
jgi:hypothetical protein